MIYITVEYENNKYKEFAPAKFVRSYLKSAAGKIGIDNAELSVTFSEEESMHSMNLEYRNIDDSTDILSFAVEDEIDGFDFVLPEDSRRNLGDMVICPEVLSRNAERFSVSEEEELRRLLIHGLLHLSGYDHRTNDSSEPMLVLQEQILKELS